VAPDGEIAEIPEILKKYSEPPAKLLKQAKPQIDALKEVAKLKNGMPLNCALMADADADTFLVPPKARGKWKRGAAKPESGRAVEHQYDVDELLEAGKETAARLKQGKPKIDKDNSIPMFKQLVQQLAEADNDKGIEVVTSSMGDFVRSLIKDSMGDANYDRAIENIGELRDACVGLEVPELYNDFLRDLKSKIFSDALGKGRRYMWAKLRATASGRLGLIAKSESEVSGITDEEKQVSTEFFRKKSPNARKLTYCASQAFWANN